MKILIEIKEDKANFLMELLHNFSFVKIKPFDAELYEFYSNLKDSIEEVKMAKKGEKELQSAEEFLDEL